MEMSPKLALGTMLAQGVYNLLLNQEALVPGVLRFVGAPDAARAWDAAAADKADAEAFETHLKRAHVKFELDNPTPIQKGILRPWGDVGHDKVSIHHKKARNKYFKLRRK